MDKQMTTSLGMGEGGEAFLFIKTFGNIIKKPAFSKNMQL
jgi:hypothetical protein